MKSFILKCIRFYKKHISPLLGNSICRFTPTCSEYTYQAINRYGIITGSWIGLKRIIRCHPWSKGGKDEL